MGRYSGAASESGVTRAGGRGASPAAGWWALLAAGALLALAACGDSLSPEERAGSYALQRVSGDTLPALIDSIRVSGGSEADTTVLLEVVSGQLDLGTDGSFSLSITGRETTRSDGSESTNSDGDALTGSYSLDGDDLSLDPGASDTLDVEDYPFRVRRNARLADREARVTLVRTGDPFADTLSLRFVR